MKYVVMTITTEEAIEILRSSKGKSVLVAIQDLGDSDKEVIFCQKLKADCEDMIMEAKTISSECDDLVNKLDVFTEEQIDLFNIEPHGLQQTILLRCN